jgi:hypothetical protein
MRAFKRLSRLAIVLAIALGPIAATDLLYGQAVTGALLGTVTDPNNAVVGGANVTVTEVNTNIKHTTTTNESGNYVFDKLPLGKYSIEVEHAGFKKVLKTEVDVSVNNTTRTDVQLEPGTVSEQVTITAIETPLQTDRADTGRIIEKAQVSELPLGFNRNFQGLLVTVPGSTRPERFHSQFFNSQDSLASRVNGQSRIFSSVEIEGVDDNEKTGLLQVLIPSAEAVEAVSITTSNYDAELGRSGGAVSNVTLKSGTNKIHGSVFGFGNNDNTLAKDYFTGAKAPTHYRQFGATIGGPIRKNKLFYFGDYQYTRDELGIVNRLTIPYPAWFNGDFRNAPTKIYDPATGNPDGTGRQQISCNGVLNVICANRISAIAQKLLTFLGAPNIAGAAFAQPNYVFNEVRIKKTQAFDVKVNHQINGKNAISYRFSFQRPNVFDPGAWGVYGGPNSSGGFDGIGTQNTISTAANYTRTFSSSLVLEARFGVSWYHNVATTLAAGKNTSTDVGIKNVNVDDFSSGLTMINISGFTGPVLGFSASLPWDRGETTYVGSGIITKIHGNHTFKFGEEIRKNRDFLLQIQDQGGVRGEFAFQGSRTAIPSDSAAINGPANAFAAFLLDLPGTVRRDLKVLDTPGTRHKAFFTFFQDRWQATKKLTLNMGLRHEFYTPLVGIVSQGGLANYNPHDNTVRVAGYGSIDQAVGVTKKWTNFAPRFGVAYRLNDKTVFRAGFGTSIVPFPDNGYAFNFPVKQTNVFPAANSFVPAGSMAAGLPAPIVFTVPANGIIDASLPVLQNSALFYIPPGLKEAKVHSWNIALQRELGWGFTGEAAYVGNVGRGIIQSLDLNAATALGAGVPGNDNAGRPFFNNFGRTASITTRIGVNTNYHSLQVKLDRRFRDGLLINTSYTISRAINYGDDSGGTAGIDTPANIKIDRGLAGFNRTHSLTESVVWAIPYARSFHGLKKWALDGWEATGIFVLQSGTPLDITMSSINLHAPGNTQRPNQNSVPAVFGNIGPGQLYFDTSVYTAPPANLTGPNGVTYAPFGNLTRNGSGINGPNFLNLDSAICKRFSFSERWRIELRADLFNALNHPSFSNPNTSFGNTNFGQINATASSPRLVRFGMRLTF